MGVSVSPLARSAPGAEHTPDKVSPTVEGESAELPQAEALVRSAQSASTPIPLDFSEPLQQSNPAPELGPHDTPLELTTPEGHTRFFKAAETPAFYRLLEGAAPGVSFTLGESRVGMRDGHIFIDTLWNRSSIELSGLKPGASIKVENRSARESEGEQDVTRPVVITTLSNGTSFQMNEGALKIEDDTFHYNSEAQPQTRSPAPLTYPLTAHSADPGATLFIQRRYDSQGERLTCAAQDCPRGATFQGFMNNSRIEVQDEGGAIIEPLRGSSPFDSSYGSVILYRSAMEFGATENEAIRCSIGGAGDQPLSISLADSPNPAGSTLGIDRERSYLPKGDTIAGETGWSDGKFSSSFTIDHNIDFSQAKIGLAYQPLVAVSRGKGDFALSPGLVDTPMTVTRTGDPSRSDVTMHSNGNLHAAVRGDSLFLFSPTADPGRAGESLGTIAVTKGPGRASVEVPITLDENGSLESFGARPAVISPEAQTTISPWGSHWWTPAAKLHDAGLKPALLNPTELREISERSATESIVALEKVALVTLDEVIPDRLEYDSNTGDFTMAGFGRGNRGFVSFEKNGSTMSLYAENLSGALLDSMAQSVWSAAGKAAEASEILAKNNDLRSAEGKTEGELSAAGFSKEEIEVARSEVGDILAHPAVHKALASIPFDFDLDTSSIEIKKLDLSFTTDSDGLSFFQGSLDLRGVQVKGALPFGEVGNAAGAIVGAPGVLHDLGEGLDKATDNNPLVAPITVPAKIVGGIFKGGGVITKALAGEVDVTLRVDISGREKPSGEWVISSNPVTIVAK